MISNKKIKNFHKQFDVVSLFIIANNKILLLKRCQNKPQAGLWGPPAGKVNKNESLIKAIQREVREETDINITKYDIQEFNKKYFVRHKTNDFIFHVFYIYLNNFIKVNINKDEHTDYGWFYPNEALQIDLIEDEQIPIKDFFNIK